MRLRRAIARTMLVATTMPLTAAAQPALDLLFTDGAVLQRDHPIYIRGRANPGEGLSATLGPANAQTTADKEGRFEFSFPAMAAGGPYRLTVAGASGSVGAVDLLMCGAAPESCRYAVGMVSGSTVTLAGDGQPVSRIRYAWAGTPPPTRGEQALALSRRRRADLVDRA